MIEGLVFDLDDTLIESEMIVENAEYKVFTENGAKILDSERPGSELFRSLSFPELFEHFIGGDEKQFKRLSEERIKVLTNEIRKVEFFPESVEVLKTLRVNGLKLGIGTGNSRSFFNLINNKLHITNLVESVVCRDEVKNGKPAPDTFLKVLENLELPPEKSLVIGDAASDMEAARAMGSIGVLITRNKKIDEGIKFDYNIKSLKELLEEPLKFLFSKK